MGLHRVFNGNTDALVYGPDGALWEALTSRVIEIDDYTTAELALGRLTDLGEVAPQDEPRDDEPQELPNDEGAN